MRPCDVVPARVVMGDISAVGCAWVFAWWWSGGGPHNGTVDHLPDRSTLEHYVDRRCVRASREGCVYGEGFESGAARHAGRTSGLEGAVLLA
jgi:hypothetical protein